MKKVLSLLLAVTMIASMVTAFAELTYTDKATISLSEVSEAKVTDDEFTVDVKLNSAADLLLGGFRIIVTADAGLTLEDITHKGFLAAGGNATKNVEKGFGSWAGSNGTTNGQDEVVFELKFKVATVEASGAKTITVTPDTDGNTFDADMNDVYIAPATATVNVVRTFAVKNAGVTAITEKQPVELGTSASDVVAALEALEFTVVGDVDTDTAKLKATGWTSETYKADKAGDYEFTGTLQAVSPVTGFTTPADATVKVTVTVGKIALTNEMVKTTVKDAGIKMVKDATEPITAAAALADDEVVAVLPTTATIAKGNFEETNATIAWAVAENSAANLDLTKVTSENIDNYVTITGTVTPAENGNFTGTATITAKIVVVPAQIAGAKVEVKGASLTTVPQVTITVPASEVNDANEVIVTITDGETTKEQKVEAAKADFVIDKKGTEDDATDDTAKLVVKFDEKYNKLGYENGDVITVGVTLNGAALADEDGDPLAIEKTVKKPVSSNSGSNVPSSTTKPVVTPEDPTEDPKDEPTTPDEPVVTPDDPNQVPQTEAPFVDVPADHWAAAPVAQLKEAGVVNGSGDGNFAPEADITRAEFTKMVVGVMGLEAAAAEVAFEDCTAEDWFTPYVAAAVEAGLVNGVSETEFAPNATITREQAFAIIGRAIDAEATTAVAFADAADIDEYAAPYVALLVELGIVGGYDDNTIRPDANITRAEAAKLLAGFMDKLNADAEVLPETEEVVEEATEEVVEEEATEEVVEEEATEEVVDEK